MYSTITPIFDRLFDAGRVHIQDDVSYLMGDHIDMLLDCLSEHTCGFFGHTPHEQQQRNLDAIRVNGQVESEFTLMPEGRSLTVRIRTQLNRRSTVVELI